MIFVSLTLLAVIFITNCVLCIRRLSRGKKNKTNNEPVWTKNEELFSAWAVTAEVLITLHIFAYLSVFGGGTGIKLTANRIIMSVVCAVLLPNNALFILEFFSSRSLNNIRVEQGNMPDQSVKVGKTMMTVVCCVYFIVVCAAALGYRFDILNLWEWFSIMLYGFIAAQGLFLMSLRKKA